MKLALECPTGMLDKVQPFADFDWLLGHKFNEKGYLDWYLSSGNTKFLDNSVNELGEPLDVASLKALADEVPGCYIVASDWIGDSKRTIEAFRECVEVFGRERVIGVIQGETFRDAMECVEVCGEGWISVPYDVCSRKDDPPWLMGLRRALLVSNIPNNRLIHLLGFTSLEEFYWYYDKPNVVSIDTGVPIYLGLLGLDILEPLASKEKPTLNQMEELKLKQEGWAAICRNIALLRKFLP
jgi:hypothetical protein